jgi:hypothetical protein
MMMIVELVGRRVEMTGGKLTEVEAYLFVGGIKEEYK